MPFFPQIAPHLVSRATVQVDILDVNDNPPEFERSNYEAAVQESAQVGTFVTHVKATSLDIGINADITYSLVAGNEQGKFTIDAKKGEKNSDALYFLFSSDIFSLADYLDSSFDFF